MAQKKLKLLDLIVRFVLVFISVVLAITALGIKRVPIEKTEADAVDRWANKWVKCQGNPGIKINVSKKEFIFYCLGETKK